MPRVLILSASIGAGHDLPAERLATDLRAAGVEVWVEDGLANMGRLIGGTVGTSTDYESEWGNRVFDVMHYLGLVWPPTRHLAGRSLQTLGGPGLLRLITARQPDVIVSTYPGVTEPLGRLRRSGRLNVPIVAAITDLASLPMWAHPNVDLHLITHPESAAEVRSIARAEPVTVRGFNPVGFDAPPSRTDARHALDLPDAGTVILVSGGGWGVGDVAGAVDIALETDAAAICVLCGTNDALRARLPNDDRVVPFGFTDRMPELMAAADILVHSTAGLTVLEAMICGTRVVSYGWGRGHIRLNNAAFKAFGLAEVATTREELRAALASPRRVEPWRGWFDLPTATEVMLARFPALQ